MDKYMFECLERLIAINSTKAPAEDGAPFGKNVALALDTMLSQAADMGFETKNEDGYFGVISYGSEPKLTLLAHLDVVPAGNGWTCDPFKLERKDGRIYGRGVADDKGPAVAALFALKDAVDKGLKHGVRIILGCDEETDWEDIAEFKKRYPEPEMVITPDASFPIVTAEKGLLHIKLYQEIEKNGSITSFNAGQRPNIVPNTAECTVCANFKNLPEYIEANGQTLTSHGVAAHGSHPEEGKNAIVRLVEYLKTLDLTCGTAEEFLFKICDMTSDCTGEAMGLAMSDAPTGALSVNWGIAKIEDGTVSAELDIRYPATVPVDLVMAIIVEQLDGIRFEVRSLKHGHLVDPECELVEKLKEAYEEVFNKPCETISCAGTTYAKAFKNAVAFGPTHPDEPSTEHGPDEWIAEKNLDDLRLALALAITKLCGE